MKIIVVIGGTFEELHAGHVKLLSEAFKIGDKVIIGLTSDDKLSINYIWTSSIHLK